jgi:hypothetical protein
MPVITPVLTTIPELGKVVKMKIQNSGFSTDQDSKPRRIRKEREMKPKQHYLN